MGEDQQTVGFIIPIYNESKLLRSEVTDLSAFLDDLGISFEIILIENGSQDGTPEIVRNLEETFDRVNGYSLDEADYGQALKKGMKTTPHEINFLLNIDWWDTQFIKNALSFIEDYDLVVGSKRLDGSVDRRSAYRKLLSWGLNTLLWILVGFSGTETHGLKCFRKSGVRDILEQCRMSRGMFDTEVIIRAEKKNLRKIEIPVILEEDRPARNWMFQKIGQNLVDIVWLTYIIRREYGFSG